MEQIQLYEVSLKLNAFLDKYIVDSRQTTKNKEEENEKNM